MKELKIICRRQKKNKQKERLDYKHKKTKKREKKFLKSRILIKFPSTTL